MNDEPIPPRLPKYTVIKGKRTNRTPKPGDLFRVEMTFAADKRPFGFLFGRCIANDCDVTGFEEHKVNLVYVFRPTESRAGDELPSLSVDNLLLPPFGAGHVFWRNGMFRAVGQRPDFGPGERLEQHCFYHVMQRSYFDENGIQLAARSEPCGYVGLNTVGYVELMLSEALEGITVNSTPPANVRHEPWYPAWQAERGRQYDAEMAEARRRMEERHRREAGN